MYEYINTSEVSSIGPFRRGLPFFGDKLLEFRVRYLFLCSSVLSVLRGSDVRTDTSDDSGETLFKTQNTIRFVVRA